MEKASREYVRSELSRYSKEALVEAMEQSFFLFAHYAKLLNDYDAGKRIVFRNALEYMRRNSNENPDEIEKKRSDAALLLP